MLERDAVIVAMTGGRHPLHEAGALIDAYDHAQAETIRTIADEWDGWIEKQIVLRSVADMIDPEVLA